MPSIRRLSVLAVMGMTLVLAQPTTAFQVLDESGTTGEYTINDNGFQP